MNLVQAFTAYVENVALYRNLTNEPRGELVFQNQPVQLGICNLVVIDQLEYLMNILKKIYQMDIDLSISTKQFKQDEIAYGYCVLVSRSIC